MTSLHPAAIGIVERMHRQLKGFIKCYATLNWSEVLLLRLHACPKEDIGVSPEEMVLLPVLVSSWRVLQKFHALTEEIFLQRLRLHTRKFRLVPTSHHSHSDVFVQPDLRTSTHVFVHSDTIRKPLEQPYQGPFKVIHKKKKFLPSVLTGVSFFLDRPVRTCLRST
ncbi:hypothetical protein AVEN_70605-1 [Araneus ventricosus]|uniref:Integrase catalytic domain-containing protein n=1 Tax=Araneus ventricosus TaxID=182803 RepID=A0A4Y2CHG5_ARAVE|nr:hypothetical protein AVEN_70605-1 [Araneus ventricosus]